MAGKTKKRAEHSWVHAGGKAGEIAHCERCGDGLVMQLPQDMEVVLAAMKAFDKVHGRCADTGRTEPRPLSPLEWLSGRDIGTSSLTIWSVITGFPSPHNYYDVPHDPADFGRCYRLLQLFPEWRAMLPQVSAKYPEWMPFVSNWDRLTLMYESALALSSESVPEMYKFMKGLRA